MLSSVVRELWLDDLSAVPAGTHGGLIGACAALVGGEPMRALALLAEADNSAADAELTNAIRFAAARLNGGWWPGPTTALDAVEMESDRPDPTAPDPARRLLLTWIGNVIPEALNLRGLASGAYRVSPTSARQMLNSLLIPRIDQRRKLAEETGDAVGIAHSHLLALDVCRRAGVPDLPADAMRAARAGVETGPFSGAYHLALGDRQVTPLQSPETLGFDLGARNDPRLLGDRSAIARARDHYRAASAAFETNSSPRGVAAAALRLAWIAQLEGNPGSAPELAAVARQFVEAGDGAGWALATTHRIIAEMVNGRLAKARPREIDSLVSWGLERGSRSYAIGCTQLLHNVALDLQRSGEIEASLATFELVRRGFRGLGSPAGDSAVAGDLSGLYDLLNSRGATIAILEEAIGELLIPHGGPDGDGPLPLLVWVKLVELLTSLSREFGGEQDVDGLIEISSRIERALSRAPGHARTLAPSAEDMLVGLERAKRRLAELGAARGGPNGGGSDWAVLEAANIDFLVQSISSTAAQAAVLAARASAEQAARQGRTRDADTLFQAALSAAQPFGETLALSVLGMWRKKGEALARTRAFLEPEPDIAPEYAATLWLNAGDFESAAKTLASAGRSEPPPRGDGWRRDWDSCGLRARIALGCRQPGEAARFADEGIARFERWFAPVSSDAFRVAVIDDGTVRRVYQASASAKIELGDHAAALVAADRIRSLALGRLAAEAVVEDTVVSPAVRAWRQAKAESQGAFDRRRAAWRRRDPAVLQSTAAGVLAAQNRLDEVAATLERVAPHMLRARNDPISVMSPASVVSCLDADTLLVQYLLADDELLTWTADRSGVRGRRVELDSIKLTGIINRLHAAWSGARAYENTDEMDAATVATQLLDPVRSSLEHFERVIFVPSGSMNVLPFHALPFGRALLGDDHVTSQLPAASLITTLSGRQRLRPASRIAVVGDPTTDPTRGLRPLPGAAVEAEAVARALGGTAIIGAAADKEAVRTALLGASVVHLATHGILDVSAPNLSSLVLAGKDELTVAELMGLGMNIDLAVLSACDSGRGDITHGGEVVGLTRGLLAAGVRNAIVSLWPVDDLCGCLTMATFADQVAGGQTFATALAIARRTVRDTTEIDRQDWYAGLAAKSDVLAKTAGRRDAGAETTPAMTSAHPMWWAPFVHIGA